MRKRADDEGVDLLLVDTGDRVEGNGLYDASTPKGLFLNNVLREQYIDIICTGNHELYQASTAKREHESTVPIFKDTYLASNLDYIDPKTGDRVPQAPQRYRKFKTKNQGIEIVAFGFLFDFTGNANNTVVQPVEDTVKEKWFQGAIHEKPDLFVVIGHVGLRMPEFQVIFAAIRKHNRDTPIAFFGGHAHVRDALSFDANAFAMASGRYMETVGWMSMDGIVAEKGGGKMTKAAATFSRKYIDNNLFGYYRHTGLNESTFPTSRGKQVSTLITRARKTLDLDYSFGCAPKDLWMTRAEYPSESSIYTWLETEVLPDVAVNKDRKDVPRLAMFNTGGIRFDIFGGRFTRDSAYLVSPFVSGLKYIPDVPYKVAKKVILLLNGEGKMFEGAALDPRYLASPEQAFAKKPPVLVPDTDTHLELRDLNVQEPLRGDEDPSDRPNLTTGYTTIDDVGDEGDDTVHAPLSFYAVPNCVQAEIGFPGDGAEPDKVDVVFIDFIQPWVIAALKLSGAQYSNEDVAVYREGTFTYHMSEWIKENWKGDC
jgi:hypothetical protein